MSTTVARPTSLSARIRGRRGFFSFAALLVAFPFLISFLVDGAGISAVLQNSRGNARFLQGLAIEIFILAIYAISYDLILGVTGLLSFGHAMFFAVGAYGFGIAVKTFEMGLWGSLLVVLVLAVLQALLFAVVLPRVKGITFALVTLGLASVFAIIIKSSDLQSVAGAEIGLQGVVAPAAYLDTTNNRFIFYLIAGALLLAVYLIYTMVVDSPTGRVFVAIRENEDRTMMLGYNTFWFKLVALVISSVTASLAGVLHTLHQPIVTPNVAGLGWTVTALLMILIGGLGTISGAIVGAIVFRLIQFYLDRWFGGASEVLIGFTYVALVLYLPYGIVGTWRFRAANRAAGRARLVRLLSGRGRDKS